MYPVAGGDCNRRQGGERRGQASPTPVRRQTADAARKTALQVQVELVPSACSGSPLPPMEPWWPATRCQLCEAVVSDVHAVVRHHRQGREWHVQLAKRLRFVCEELPLRRLIPLAQQREAIAACSEMWEDHEESFSRMVWASREPRFAAKLCRELRLCTTWL